MRVITFNQPAAGKFKDILKKRGFSGRSLHQIRHHGGSIEVEVAHKKVDGTKLDVLPKGATVKITLPKEAFKQPLTPSFVPLAILYEDEDYLIVNKPAFTPSVPSPLYRNDDIVRRVAGYFTVRGYTAQIPHIVTRLDRDTSGCCLIAKHAFAHSLISRSHSINKTYLALLNNQLQTKRFLVSLPLERTANSIIKRQVASKSNHGKFAQSVFCYDHQNKHGDTWCLVKLLTGRTHQIRVHAQVIGHSLVGDGLYGTKSAQITRQALHCYQLEFIQPITKQKIICQAPLAEDLAKLW